MHKHIKTKRQNRKTQKQDLWKMATIGNYSRVGGGTKMIGRRGMWGGEGSWGGSRVSGKIK